jgi:hypothetical protein
MSKQSFVKRVSDEAERYAQELAEAMANPQRVSEHDLALAILDAGDNQGWDRLTWTGDPDEYSASYGYDAEGNEFDPVPPPSALEFARYLLRDYDVIKRPTYRNVIGGRIDP